MYPLHRGTLKQPLISQGMNGFDMMSKVFDAVKLSVRIVPYMLTTYGLQQSFLLFTKYRKQQHGKRGIKPFHPNLAEELLEIHENSNDIAEVETYKK